MSLFLYVIVLSLVSVLSKSFQSEISKKSVDQAAGLVCSVIWPLIAFFGFFEVFSAVFFFAFFEPVFDVFRLFLTFFGHFLTYFWLFLTFGFWRFSDLILTFFFGYFWRFFPAIFDDISAIFDVFSSLLTFFGIALNQHWYKTCNLTCP